MEAATWTAIAVLAGALFGTVFWLGSRIDALGASLGARIDGLEARIDTQGARIDRLSERVGELTAELRTHLRAHSN